MPKTFSIFNISMQKEFPFLKAVTGSESDVMCSLCNVKFNVVDGGRTRIKAHLNTLKHIKGSKSVDSNQSIKSFMIDESTHQLQTKELFAYHIELKKL